MLRFRVAKYRFIRTYWRKWFLGLPGTQDSHVCSAIAQSSGLPRKAQSHPLWLEAWEYSMRGPRTLSDQGGRLWLRMPCQGASLYLCVIAILSSTWGHSEDQIQWEGWHLVSRLHSRWTFHGTTAFPRQQRTGAARVYYAGSGSLPRSHDWQK